MIDFLKIGVFVFAKKLSYGTLFIISSFMKNANNFSKCDGKLTKIPKRDFILRTCEAGADWHLIPCRISPCSESFLGHIGTGILCGGLIHG